MSLAFVLFLTLGALCLAGALISAHENNPVAVLILAGYGLLFGILAARERR